VTSTKEIEVPDPLRLAMRKVQKEELTPLLDLPDSNDSDDTDVARPI
jgi:hypothetical protein